MKKGEIYEGFVEKVSFPNKGIIYIDDKKVIVKNAIPGQKIRFIINKKEKTRQREGFLRCFSAQKLKKANQYAAYFHSVADVHIRQWHMRSSLR